jgi:hypothetical protein
VGNDHQKVFGENDVIIGFPRKLIDHSDKFDLSLEIGSD